MWNTRAENKNGKGRCEERKMDCAHAWRYKMRNKWKNDTKMGIKIGQNSSEKWCWSRWTYTFRTGIGEVRDEYSLLPREKTDRSGMREKEKRTNEQNKNVKPQKHRTVHKAIFISNNELQCKHVTWFSQFDRSTVHRVEWLLLLWCDFRAVRETHSACFFYGTLLSVRSAMRGGCGNGIAGANRRTFKYDDATT